MLSLFWSSEELVMGTDVPSSFEEPFDDTPNTACPNTLRLMATFMIIPPFLYPASAGCLGS